MSEEQQQSDETTEKKPVDVHIYLDGSQLSDILGRQLVKAIQERREREQREKEQGG